jgi:hypothetical protein
MTVPRIPIALAIAAVATGCHEAPPSALVFRAATPSATEAASPATSASSASHASEAPAVRPDSPTKGDFAAKEDRKPLTLAPGGATLVVGDGARIESIDPETAAVVATIEPVRLPGFVWERFLKRGRFLLAEGRGETAPGPVPYYLRGLALIDDAGRVLWTKTQPMMQNRVSHQIFLDEEGSVAFDSLAGSGLIARDGSVLDTASVPAGPVLHGTRNFLPLRHGCAPEASSWLRLDTMQSFDSPPDSLVDALPLHAIVEDERIAFVATVDPYPENDFFRFAARTVAHVPFPPGCRGQDRTVVATTLSPRHEVLECWNDERSIEATGPATPALFDVDARSRTVRPIRVPASDPSGVAPEARMHDIVSATVRADGAMVATVWNTCTSTVYVSAPSAAWKKIPWAPLFGPPVDPVPVCGHLTLQPTAMPSNMGCGQSAGAVNPADVTYVEQPDGTWRTLPFEIGAARAQDCSADSAFVAFVHGDLTVARFDSDGRQVIRAAPAKSAFAWLP